MAAMGFAGMKLGVPPAPTENVTAHKINDIRFV